jgi:ketosteroid isomerase-like protein
METAGWKRIDLYACSGLLSDTFMLAAATNFSIPMNRRLWLAPMLVPVLMLTAPVHPTQAQTLRPEMRLAQMPRAQRHESRHEIDHLEDAWRDAVLKQNIAAMDALLADDYMAITSSGTLQTKEEALANLRAGRVHFTALDISDRKVRFYGTTAVVTSVAQVQGTNADGPVSGSYRYTRVYARNARGEWKVVNFEASKIREPVERK